MDNAKRIRAILMVLLSALAVMYILQIFSPLRINTDAYRLLRMAVSSLQGKGYLVDGREDQFTRGYPWILALLTRMHLGSSGIFITFNILCLALGLFHVFLLLTKMNYLSQLQAWLVIVLTLTSWVVVKHVTIPLTDIPFMGVSLSSLYWWNRYWTSHYREKWNCMILGLVWAWIALQIRSVGITLFPMIILVILFHRDNQQFFEWIRKYRSKVMITAAVLLFGLVIMAFILLYGLSKTEWYRLQFRNPQSYFQSFKKILGHDGLFSFILKCLGYRFREYSSILMNVPMSKLRLPNYVCLASGCLLLLCSCPVAIISARKDCSPFAIYFLSYSGLLLIWPYYDERFLIPVLPLIFAFIIKAFSYLIRLKINRWRAVSYSYIAFYVILGFVSLFYSTRISLNHSEFSERYGDGSLRMTYRYAFGSNYVVDFKQVDMKYVELIKMFDSPQRLQ